MNYSKTNDDTSKIIAAMFAAYGQSGDGNRIAIYSKVLGEAIPLPLLKKTVNKVLIESKFIPSISEIVAASKDLAGDIDSKYKVPGWDEAWAEIMAQASRTSFFADGSFYTPPWTNEMARKTAVRFGWRNLCGMEERNYNSAHAQCREIYQSIIRRKETHDNNVFVLGLGQNGQKLIERAMPTVCMLMEQK